MDNGVARYGELAHGRDRHRPRWVSERLTRPLEPNGLPMEPRILEVERKRRKICWWCAVVLVAALAMVPWAFGIYGITGHVNDVLHLVTGWRQ